jgi:hypothetical protein
MGEVLSVDKGGDEVVVVCPKCDGLGADVAKVLRIAKKNAKLRSGAA